MKKFVLFLALASSVFLVATRVIGGSFTSNLTLYKPSVSEEDWGAEVNSNFDKIDTMGGAKFIMQQPNAQTPNEQALSTLATGIAKITAGTGVITTITDLAGLNTALGTSLTESGSATECSTAACALDASTTHAGNAIVSSGTSAGGDLTGNYPNPTLADGTVQPDDLDATDSPGDGEVPTYDSATQRFEWAAGGGGGGGGTECSSSSCDLHEDTTLNTQDICLGDMTGCSSTIILESEINSIAELNAIVGKTLVNTTDSANLLGIHDYSGGGYIFPNSTTLPASEGDPGQVYFDYNQGDDGTLYITDSGGGWVARAGDMSSEAATADTVMVYSDASGDTVKPTGCTYDFNTLELTCPAVGSTGDAAGQILIYEATANGSNSTTIQSLDSMAADVVYTLPPDDGDAGEQLQTDGSGVLTWEAAGSGGSGATSFPIYPYSGKLSGAFVTATISGVDTASQGAEIDAGQGPWRVLFDETTDEAIIFYGILPSNYASTPVVNLIYSMVSATTAEVDWEAAVMCVTPGDAADVATASFAAAGTSSVTVPGTAGHTDTLVAITPTDDSCSALDLIYIYVSTDANDPTGDDATGDRELVGAYGSFTQ